MSNSGPNGAGVLGIIAEYDPFHNGHAYHLARSREITGAGSVIAVMSGDFIQRGGPAMFDKRMRAEVAVRNGVDLVIELPFVYACGNAEHFARGAVGILDGLGIVDYISFGSEGGDLEDLMDLARYFTGDTERSDAAVREAMRTGVSYPMALELAAAGSVGAEAAAALRLPNNTLAVEYLRQLIIIKSRIKPVTVKRYAAGLDEAASEAGIAGATAIRNMLLEGREASQYLPAVTGDAIREYLRSGRKLLSIGDMFVPLLMAELWADRGALADVLSATEGLDNRLHAAARAATDMEELIRLTKSKRYTETRIRRLICHTVVGLTKSAMSAALNEPIYAKVLAFSDNGAGMIRRIKKLKDGVIPIVSNPNKEGSVMRDSPATDAFDIRAADIRHVVEYGALAGFDDSKNPPKRAQ